MSSPDDRIILTRGNLQALIDKIKAEITGPTALAAHPVLSYYWSDDPTDPAILFGGGTWVRVKDTFIWAMGDNDTLGATGGSKTVTLTSDQMPSHTHTFTGTAHTHTYTPQGEVSSHRHWMKAHVHGLYNHTHSLSGHVHSMQSHTHSLENHVHSMQAHTHNLTYNNNGSTAWGSGATTYNSDGSATKTLSGTLLVRAVEDIGPAISIKGSSNILTAGSESGSWNGADIQTGLSATNITIDVTHSHLISGHTSTPMNSAGSGTVAYTGTPVNSSGTVVANTGVTNTTYTGTPVNSSGEATDVTGVPSINRTTSPKNTDLADEPYTDYTQSSFTGTQASLTATATGTNGSTGGGAAHNNMPPYRCAYCWQRTA